MTESMELVFVSDMQIYTESAQAKLPAVQDYLTTMIEVRNTMCICLSYIDVHVTISRLVSGNANRSKLVMISGS